MDLKTIFDEINTLNEKDTINISYCIIDYCKRKKIEITNLKLNKLLYFINIVYMLENAGMPIFNEEFLAWRHGPILQSVYNKFCYGIVLPTDEKLDLIKKNMSTDKMTIINKVLEEKAKTPAWQLVELTHIRKGPWESIYNKNKDEIGICRAKIPNKDIYNFYKEQKYEI